MNAEQFERYTQGLALLSNESRQASQAAAMRSERNKLTDKLIRQTVFCDGSSASATRAWLDDVSLAYGRIGQSCIMEIASSIVTGSLRKELERFLHEQLESGIYNSRDVVPWAVLRVHVSKTFLNVDEAATLRDTLENIRQSAYETDASFTRRFRDIAQDCYPADYRNVDQDRILIRCFARGLRSVPVAVKMIEQCNPKTLQESMQWLARFSERTDAVSRLGLSTSEDVPMEISALPPPSHIAAESQTQILERLWKSQEHIMTKLAKIEASQAQKQHYGQTKQRRPGSKQTSDSNDLPNWSADGKPKCFNCQKYGHFSRDCRQRTNDRQGGPSNSSGPQMPHPQGN